MAQSTKGNKKQNKQQNKKDKLSQNKKKNATKKSSSICPYVLGTVIVIGAIAGVIGYDVHINGGIFEKSSTGKLLKDTGALSYVEIAWYKSMSTSARGYKWLEKNVPVYFEVTREFLKPYCTLTADLGKITLGVLGNLTETIVEVFNRKAPVVGDFVDQYVPGFSKKVQEISSTAWSSSVNAYHASCVFFKTKVFVGSLSPESLNKVMSETQIAAAKYYSWFYEKVDIYAKIK